MEFDRKAFIKQLVCDLSGVYVELGTCWGGLAEFLLLETPCQFLYCVDPYKVFPKDQYYDALNFTNQEFLDQKYEAVHQRLIRLGKPVRMLRQTSYEASKMMINEISFVYIDGNHHYNEVLKDLVRWWPKVRKGGILAGDDVEDINLNHKDGDVLIERVGSFGVYGVATALADFARICPDFHYTVVGNQFWARKK
jgi:cephalosporin hydroxylase